MLKILFFVTLGIILMFSAVSMAKPGFYILSDLRTPDQFVMELGAPDAQRVSDPNQVEFLYRAGMVKPFCIDYEMTFSKGMLSTWTWRFCTNVPAFSEPPSTPELAAPSLS
jgi:hypothetical protein